jgi:hypothetical protein
VPGRMVGMALKCRFDPPPRFFGENRLFAQAKVVPTSSICIVGDSENGRRLGLREIRQPERARSLFSNSPDDEIVEFGLVVCHVTPFELIVLHQQLQRDAHYRVRRYSFFLRRFCALQIAS